MEKEQLPNEQDHSVCWLCLAESNLPKPVQFAEEAMAGAGAPRAEVLA